MKRVIQSYSLLFIALLLCTSACDNDDPVPTKTDLLTSKPWKLTFIKIMDVESVPSDCTKDDIHTFNKDMTSSRDEGATKCNPDNTQTKNGTWRLNSSETVLILTTGKGSSGYSINEQILELTASSLKVKYSVIGIAIEEHYEH